MGSEAMHGTRARLMVVAAAVSLSLGACGVGSASPESTASSGPPLATASPRPTAAPIGMLPVGRVVFDRLIGDAEGAYVGTFTLDTAGLETAMPAPAGAEGVTAVWSPDGRRLLLNAYVPATGPVVSIYDLSKKGTPAPLGHDGVNGDVECTDWTPDGSRVVCYVGSEDTSVDGIYIIDVAKGSATRLTHSQYHHVVGTSGECGGGEGRAVFSPDGSRIAFEQQRCGSGSDPSSDEAGDIVVMNADGSNETVIVPFGAVRTHPGGEISWSPTDDIITYGDQGGDLRTVRADGSDLQMVALPMLGFAYGPGWSPDGKWILVTISDATTGQHDLFAISADGSTTIRITDDDAVEAYTDWGPAGT